MRTFVRVGLALLIALALSTPVSAQPSDRLSFNAAIGPSFANLGTTFSTLAGVDYALTDRMTLVGEFGALPHAPFKSDLNLTAPLASQGSASRVNAYHWNGNVRVRPFDTDRLTPYLTAGIGAFHTDAVVRELSSGAVTVEDRRRVSDLATNLGAGVQYHLNDWLGLTADYRTFFVHRESDTPAVNRFTAGFTLSLK